MTDQFAEIRDHFVAALERDGLAAQLQYAADQCGHSPELRAGLEAMLRAHHQTEGFLASRADMTQDAPEIAEALGTQVGPYKLLQEIGQGGMGVVYMADQHQPIRRKVALKIIKPGMDTRQVIARFEAERQALSLMDHPNIARVLDAGSTDSGRPFFVMELVKGQPITQYCDEQQLAPRDRLRLFLTVCHAIQHAHQKGIIHRDIKPSNVLVAEYDGRPVTKVIDFGIAKAVNQPLTEKTMFTGYGQIIGTLEYMSPEQARLNQLDIDTRSDIYSLGVLLYELLTGTTPFDKQRLRLAAWDEMLRIIREEEPPKPSTRLSDSKESLPSISAQRQTEPAELTRLVRGELDWIVMKALDKDRARRYESASAFANDIESHMRDEPVDACPPSAGYRLKKLARRHRTLLLTAIAFTTTLLVGAVVCAWQAIEATRARQRADANFQLASQAVNITVTRIEQEPQLKEGDFLELRKSLLEGVAPFLETLAQQDETDDSGLEANRGLSLTRLAQLHADKGEYAAARTDCEHAKATFLKLIAANPSQLSLQSDLAKAQTLLADILAKLREVGAAESEFSAAIERLTNLVADSPRDQEILKRLSTAHTNYGNLLGDLGKPVDAGSHFQSSKAIDERLVAEFPENTEYLLSLAVDHMHTGLVYGRQSMFKEAEKEIRQGSVLAEQLVAKKPLATLHRRLLVTMQVNLGWILREQGRFPEAETALRQSIASAKQLAEGLPDSVEYQRLHAACHKELGALLATAGRLAEAERAYRANLDIRDSLFKKSPVDQEFNAEGHYSLARVQQAQGKYADALKEFQAALEIRQSLAAQSPEIISNQSNLIDIHASLQRVWQSLNNDSEAESAGRAAVAMADQLAAKFPQEPTFHTRVVACRSDLGSILERAGRHHDAEQELRAALRLGEPLIKVVANDVRLRSTLADCHQDLADILAKAGQHAEAETEYQLALTMKRSLIEETPHDQNRLEVLATSHLSFAFFLSSLPNRDEDAHREFERGLALCESLASKNPERAGYHHNLYLAHSKWGRLRSKNGKHLEALGAYRRATQAYELSVATSLQDIRTASDLYNGACVFSLASQTLDDDSEQSDTLAKRAVALLRMAQAAGLNDVAKINRDTDFAPIRERPDFQDLLRSFSTETP